MNIKTLGIDLSKSVFQLHGVDAIGKPVLKKKLSREKLPKFMATLPPCEVVMEACGGANFWAREFKNYGHSVKLISPQFVKPFVKGNKNDCNDSEAIVEAASRPTMRYVFPKSIELRILFQSNTDSTFCPNTHSTISRTLYQRI